MIDLDFTAVIQFVNFLITLVVLNYLLITPIRKIIKKRKESLEQMHDSAMTAEESIDAKLTNYNASLVKYRDEAAVVRENLRNEALVREREMTEKAQSDAQLRIQTARADIAAQVEKAMSELTHTVPALAKEAANRIMA